MPFHTAAADHIEHLYHWQSFTPATAGWLEHTLRTGEIYCPSPGDFNDPWDCKPYFDTTVPLVPAQNDELIAWATRLRIATSPGITDAEIAHMKQVLRTDYVRGAAIIEQISADVQVANAKRYRVFCFGTDPLNQLMWAHYGDKHRGIAMEFNVQTATICGALRVEYLPRYPAMAVHSTADDDNLLILTSKSDVWGYEKEYRLIAQESANAISGGTLMTHNNYLTLSRGALATIVVGCEGDHRTVLNLTQRYGGAVAVRKLARVPNRYELRW